MQELKLTPEGLRSMSRRSVRAQVILIAVTGILYIGYLAWTSHGLFNFSDYLPIIAVAGVYGFLLFTGIQRSKKVLAGLTFLYDGTSITRKLPTTRDMTIHFLEVSNVSWYRNGLIITGVTSADKIWIPQDLEHFDEIEATLKTFLPEDQRKPENRTLRIITRIVSTTPMLAGLAIFLVNDPTWVLVAGIIFIVTVPVLAYNLFRNKLARTSRKIYLGVLLLVMLVTLIVKLSGTPLEELLQRFFSLFTRF